MDIKEAITLGIALAGLLLGIRSEWRAHRRDKPRLRVIPKVAFPVGPVSDMRPRLAFEIINDGFLPVTVSEVGLHYRGTRERGALTPLLLGDKTWPHRLDAHSAIVAYSEPDALLDPSIRTIKRAYVATATDEVFYGHSRALKHIAKTGEIPAPRRRLARDGFAAFIAISDFDDGF